VNSAPLVSIITTCYNHEKYLDDYFNGLLNQTYKNIELILFDDGSKDGSWEKICSYESKLKGAFPRVICERHNDMGAHREVDLALKVVRGEFLCIYEADDYYLPEKVQENVNYLINHPRVGAVYSDWREIDQHGNMLCDRKSKVMHMYSGDVFESLLRGPLIRTATF